MTLTQVHVDLRRPDGSTEVATAGDVEFALTSRVHDETGDFIVTTESFAADLVDGQVTVSLRPTDVGQAWTSRENVPGGIRRWFTVPTSATVVQYADLVDVDPNTLTPVPADAQWVVDLNVEIARATEVEAGLETRLAARESESAGFGDIVTRDASEFATTGRVADIESDYTTSGELSSAVAAAISALVDGAPGALDTLNELAAAVNDDASFAAAVTAALATKATVASLSAEAALARNADNLNSGTVPDARIVVGKELAYAENATGDATSVPTNTASFVPYCYMIVPATVGPVSISWGGSMNVGTPGGGDGILELWNLTDAVKVMGAARGFVTSQISAYSGYAQPLRGECRIAASATDRIFSLRVVKFLDSGSALTLNLTNGVYSATNATPTWMRATAL